MNIDEHRAHLNRQPDSFFRPSRADAVSVLSDRASRYGQSTSANFLAADERAKSFLDTGSGRYLAEHSRDLGEKRTGELADIIEMRFAASAAGRVETFFAGAAPDSNARHVVIEALLTNRRITHINGIARDDIMARPKELRFETIWAAELLRDERLFKLSPERGRLDDAALLRGPGPELKPAGQELKPPEPVLDEVRALRAIVLVREQAAFAREKAMREHRQTIEAAREQRRRNREPGRLRDEDRDG